VIKSLAYSTTENLNDSVLVLGPNCVAG